MLSGQVVGRCDKVEFALTYQWRYAAALMPAAWTQADAVLRASFTVAGPMPGTQYIVQARVIGTSGPSDWTNSAALIAL